MLLSGDIYSPAPIKEKYSAALAPSKIFIIAHSVAPIVNFLSVAPIVNFISVAALCAEGASAQALYYITVFFFAV